MARSVLSDPFLYNEEAAFAYVQAHLCNPSHFEQQEGISTRQLQRTFNQAGNREDHT